MSFRFLVGCGLVADLGGVGLVIWAFLAPGLETSSLLTYVALGVALMMFGGLCYLKAFMDRARERESAPVNQA